jgi:hypothetical protein
MRETTTTISGLPSRNLSVPEFCDWSRLGRTSVCKIIAKGELRPLKYGRRTLIPMEEALRWRNSLASM